MTWRDSWPLRDAPCGGKVCLVNVGDACHARDLPDRPRDRHMITDNRAAGWQRTRRCYHVPYVVRKELRLVTDRGYSKPPDLSVGSMTDSPRAGSRCGRRGGREASTWNTPGVSI